MEQLTNLIISDRELAIISTALNKLVLDTSASSVMLIDKSGQVVATQGSGVRRNATSLGALLAGAFSSSRHIAELLGEKDFRTIFQQGVNENIYTTLVEEQWLLVIVFDKLTHIGQSALQKSLRRAWPCTRAGEVRYHPQEIFGYQCRVSFLGRRYH